MKTLTPLRFYLKWPIFFFLLLFASTINAQQETTENESIDFDCTGQLEIKKFKKMNAPKNKVVVGIPIKYEAKPKNYDAYTWTLGDLQGNQTIVFWTLDDNGQAPFQAPQNGKGETTIPNSTLPLDNSDFGSTHGHLALTANGESAEETIEVFFEKGVINPHDPGGVPNWFYYWKKALAIQSISLHVYNPDDPSNPNSINVAINPIYSNSGIFSWNPTGNMYLGRTTTIPRERIPIDINDPMGDTYSLNYEVVMTLGEGTSKMCAHTYDVVLDPSGNIINVIAVTGTGYTGISCFNQVYIHEYEHVKIFKDIWPKGWREGWDADGDFYSDDFEIANSIIHGFDLNIPTPFSEGSGTVGWDYEEDRCRTIEDAVDPNLLIPFDWSFDRTNEFQGKQW